MTQIWEICKRNFTEKGDNDKHDQLNRNQEETKESELENVEIKPKNDQPNPKDSTNKRHISAYFRTKPKVGGTNRKCACCKEKHWSNAS